MLWGVSYVLHEVSGVNASVIGGHKIIENDHNEAIHGNALLYNVTVKK
jgi:hypothetical protein